MSVTDIMLGKVSFCRCTCNGTGEYQSRILVWPGPGSEQGHNKQGTQHPRIFGRRHISPVSENKKDAGLMCPRPTWSWLKLLDVTRPLDKASLGYILSPCPDPGRQQAWTAQCMNGSTRERRIHEIGSNQLPYRNPIHHNFAPFCGGSYCVDSIKNAWSSDSIKLIRPGPSSYHRSHTHTIKNS